MSTEKMSSSAVIHLVFVLKLNNEAALDSFIAQSRTRGSSNFGATLSSAQILKQYAPTIAQIATVTAYLRNHGFADIQAASNNMLVEADAPTSVVEATLQTQMTQANMSDGSVAHINATAMTLPNALTSIVASVHGLDTVHRPHTHAVQIQLGSGAQASTNSGASNAVAGTVVHNPVSFPFIYGVADAPAATGITVGIIAEGDLTQTPIDLATFESSNNLSSTPVSIIYTGTQSTDTSNNSEWSLDSQTIVGMSGGVKNINFYVASSLSWNDMLTAINRAQSDNTAKVINMSIGGCEAYAPTGAIDSILKLAVAQGQTFSVSTGDTGSTAFLCGSPSVEYPASSPYVVAVGGTSLSTNADGSYASETAWADSGGGRSTVEPLPSWQSSVPALSGLSVRSIPDVAFDADPNSGANIYVNGQQQQWGGTSLAAPLFAGIWARQLASSAPNSAVFAAPTLYSRAAQNPSSFHDITSGSNGAYTASSGWDYVTGWGSFIWSMSDVIAIATASDPVHGATLAVLKSDGSVLARTGRQTGWVYELGGVTAIAVASDAVNGPTLGVLESGVAFAKTGLQSPWITEATGATSVAIASDAVNGPTLGVLESGVVLAKTGLQSPWITETTGATSIAVASDAINGPTLGVLESGVALTKTGLQSPWITETTGATSIALASDSTNGPTLGVLESGVVLIKTGLQSAWITEMTGASSIALASDSANGPTLGVLGSGVALTKTGLQSAWITEMTGLTSIALASDSTNGPTLGALGSGVFLAKTGLQSAWITQ